MYILYLAKLKERGRLFLEGTDDDDHRALRHPHPAYGLTAPSSRTAQTTAVA